MHIFVTIYRFKEVKIQIIAVILQNVAIIDNITCLCVDYEVNKVLKIFF